MTRISQAVHVHGIQDRRASERVKKPWVVRWSVESREKSRSFRTRGEADRFRTRLIGAHAVGELFDPATGEPATWRPQLADCTVYDWARRWFGEQWPEWAPRTRKSAAESLSRLIMLAVDAAPPDGDDELRRYANKALLPTRTSVDDAWEDWLRDHSLRLADLDRVNVGEIDRRLALRMDGAPLAATSANRTRIVCRACILAAVDANATRGDVWPQRSTSRARRKVARVRKSVDVRQLPDPATMERAIAAMATRQPGSHTYQLMTSVAYYSGLRPSEVIMLRARSLELSVIGWGKIYVTEADISFDEPGEPKTGPRVVPIPAVLVDRLRRWVAERSLDGDDLLFRTVGDQRPNQGNWRRSWHRALASIGHPSLRIYDLRHAAATTWLRSGVPLGETARRMGHSVDTLVTTYVGALIDEEDVANRKIDAMLAKSEED
jgi:integrase